MPTTDHAHSFPKRIATITLATALIVGSALTTNPRSVQAAGSTITVNSLSDDQTAGTGVCLQMGTICLRNAIATANAASSETTVNFSVSGTITIGATLIINNPSVAITIDGTGQSVIIDGGSTSNTTGVQVFSVSTQSVAIVDALTIQHGNMDTGNGDGGGISNSGTLTINNGQIIGNSGFVGGGISNVGTLTINNSTLSGNSALSHSGGNALGGAILSSGNSATLIINDSTIAGNFLKMGAPFSMIVREKLL